MNLMFTICARSGSKGVKNKNIRLFNEYPLPYYTLSCIELFIQRHKLQFDNIYLAVNTDSMELVDLIKKTRLYFIYVPRKSELATDTASKIDVIRDTYHYCTLTNERDFDIVIDLDLTSPLRAVEDIEKAIDTLQSDSNCDVVFSVTEARRSPYFNMVKESGGYFKRIMETGFTARQQTPLVYDLNASIYAYRDQFMYKSCSIFEGNCKTVQMPDTGVLDIDSEEDFKLMEVIAQYFYKTTRKYSEIRSNVSKIVKQ